MSTCRLLLLAAGLAALATPAGGAQSGCSDGRFLLRPEDGQLVVGAAGRDAITVLNGRVAIDSGCPADGARTARVKPLRRGTKVKAVWDLCRAQQKVRLVATITRASGCQDMTGVRRARRSPPKRWVATRSTCGDGYVDPGNQEACDGGACGDGQPCTGECACPPATTTTSSTSTSTSSTTSRSATSSTSTSTSRTTSSSSSTSTTSTSTSSSTSRSSTTSSSTSTSTSTSLPDPCPHNPAGGPSRLVLRTPFDGAGGDLDIGWSGGTHNLPLPGGARLDVCLAGCDAGSDSACAGTSPEGTDGAPLGPPVPLLSGTFPFCLVTRLDGDVVVRSADYQTGAIDAALGLTAELYVTTNVPHGAFGQICPQCTSSAPDQGGVCVGGRDDGAPCRLEATRSVLGSGGSQEYRLSSSCRPAGTPVATLSLVVDPLRTGASTAPACNGQTTPDACGGAACIDDCSRGACAFAAEDPVDPDGPLRCKDEKGGLSEHCCANGDNDRACHQAVVARTGRAVAPTADGAAPFPASGEAVLAAAFCAGATGNAVLDGTTVGLPAPAALLLPVHAAWLP